MVELRVALGRQFVYGGETYSSGDELTVPAGVALTLLRSGLVVPADGVWPEGVSIGTAPAPAPEPAAADESPNVHPQCDPGTRPKGSRGAMQICPVAGCPCPTWRGKCQVHARSNSAGKRYRDSHNDSSSLRARWDRTRRDYLRANPYCQCEECAAVPEPMRLAATEVDHIDALGLTGPRAFDWSNLQALTKSHHSAKTARESFGR